MVQQLNISNIGSGGRTTTGIVPLSGTGAVGQATPSGVIDTSQTDWMAFNVIVTGSATAQVETSFDNGANWSPIYVIKGSDSTTSAQVTASGLYFGNSIGALSRINVVSVAGGFQVTGGTTDVTNAPNGTPSTVSLGAGSAAGPAVAGGNTAAVPSANSLIVQNSPNEYAEASAFILTTTASTNAAVYKASAGSLLELDVTNLTASTIYVKLFNRAVTPVPGTDGAALVLPVAAGASTVTEFGRLGKRFTTGIGLAVTGAAADTDTTAVSAGAKVGFTYI